MNDKKKVFYCNTELTLDVIGGKWKPLIMYHMDKLGVVRFGELKRLIPNINERVLSRVLNELVDRKLIDRKDYNENPPRVEYTLSELGKTLSPIIVELGDWGKKYNYHYNYGIIEFEDDDN